MFCVNFSFKTLRVMCLHHGSLDVERVSVIRFIGRLQFKRLCYFLSVVRTCEPPAAHVHPAEAEM